MDDAPTLRARLAKADSVLSGYLEEATKIARNEWLPALPTNLGSSNAYPHLRNVAGYLEHILLAFEADPDSGFDPLSPGELYVVLLAVLFHDYGRLDPRSKSKAKDRVPHGTLSRIHLSKHYAQLGIHAPEVAELVGRVAECHEPEPEDDPDKVSLAIGLLSDVTLDPLGLVRAPLLAALVALADQMDAAYTRSIPEYLTEAQGGVIGLFRRHIRGVYVDPTARLVKTVLTLRDAERVDLPTDTRYELAIRTEKADNGYRLLVHIPYGLGLRSPDPRNGLTKDGWALHTLPGFSVMDSLTRGTALQLTCERESCVDWLGEKERRTLDDVDLHLIRLLSLRAVDMQRTTRKLAPDGSIDKTDIRVLVPMPKFGPQAIVFGSMHENHSLLRQVGPVLARYGLCLDSWLVEVDGLLFRHDGRASYEPIVNGKLLEDAAKAMWALSTSIFASASFTYEDVAAHLGDPFVCRVKVACQRVSAVTMASKVDQKDLAPWTGANNWHWNGRRTNAADHCEYVHVDEVAAIVGKLEDPRG